MTERRNRGRRMLGGGMLGMALFLVGCGGGDKKTDAGGANTTNPAATTPTNTANPNGPGWEKRPEGKAKWANGETDPAKK